MKNSWKKLFHHDAVSGAAVYQGKGDGMGRKRRTEPDFVRRIEGFGVWIASARGFHFGGVVERER